MDIVHIGDGSKDTLAVVADGNFTQFFKQKEIEKIEGDKAKTVGPYRGDGGHDKKGDSDLSVEILLGIKIFSSTGRALGKPAVLMLLGKSHRDRVGADLAFGRIGISVGVDMDGRATLRAGQRHLHWRTHSMSPS